MISRLALVPGDVLEGRYEIRQLIGRGGMGEVYCARRLELGDMVAVKCLLPSRETEADRARFLSEARAAAHIRHPNVVRVFDFGRLANGQPYMVMEYLEGFTLAELIADSGALPPSRALAIFADLCSAIEAGHRRGIVHGDIKPANIVLARADGPQPIVKVLDFGLAHIAGERTAPPDCPEGSCHYMAPEQIAGEAVTPAADVFALGTVLCEMVAGRPPFSRESAVASMLAITRCQYQLPPGGDPLRDGIAEAIAAALVRNPAERPPGAEALARLARSGLRVAASSAPGGHDSAGVQLERFFGRASELELLRRVYDEALGGQSRMAIIVGEAGSGKSRLAEELAGWARQRGARVMAGRFADHASSLAPLATFTAMLSAASEIGQGARLERLDSDADRWPVFAGFAEVFAAEARHDPLVLLFDGVDAARAVDLDLIDYLAESLSARGALVVVTTRPNASDEVETWRRRHSRCLECLEIEIACFSEAELSAWLDRIFGKLRIDPRDVRRLHDNTSGNPHHVVEVIRHLMARGAVRQTEEGEWMCERLTRIEVPDTVAALVRARLVGLDPELRGLLEIAAVLGDPLDAEVLARAANLSKAALGELVERGVQTRFFVATPRQRFRFDCAATSAVIYDGIPGDRRRALHERAVVALEAAAAGGVGELHGPLSYHHAAIGSWDGALAHGVSAAAAALARCDHDAARTALQRAQAARAAGAAAAQDAAACERIAGALALIAGQYEEGARRLEAAIATCQRLGLDELRTACAMDLARCHLGLGALDAAIAGMQRAAEAAEAIGDRRAALVARAHTAAFARRRGEHGAAVDALDQLIGELEPDDPPTLGAIVHLERAWNRLKSGQFGDAFADAERARLLAHASGDLPLQQRAVATLSAICNESGDLRRALPLERRSLELARRLGERRREAIALANLGEVHYHLGEAPVALRWFREALAIFIDIGDRACEGDCRVNIGRALLAHGDTRAAIDMLEEGRALCQATERAEYCGIALMHLAEARWAAGELDRARHEIAAAVQVFESIRSHLRWKALLLEAEIARAAGDLEHARQVAAQVAALIASQRAALPAGADPSAFELEERRLARLFGG